MCVKDNSFIKVLVGTKEGDAQLHLIFTNKEVLLAEKNVLFIADIDSDKEITKKMKPGFS